MSKIITRFILFFILIFCSRVQAINYYLKTGGSITQLTDWTDNPGGTGANPSNFISGDTWNIINNTSVTLNSVWALGPSESVVVGDGSNAITFILGSGSTTGLASNMNIFSNATLDLESNFSFPLFTSFYLGSTVIFGTNAPDLHNNHYGNVVINDNVAMPSKNVNIHGLLTINSGMVFTINGLLTLSGTIAGTGQMAGHAATTYLILNSTSNIGTLLFQPGFETIFGLDVNLSSSAKATLGTNLIVDNFTANFISGGLDLGGNTLTIGSGATLNFTGGKIIGSSSSTLKVEAAIISGSLLMDATSNTLKSLVLNSVTNLVLGNTLNITDSVSVPLGALSTGGNLNLKATSALKARVGLVGGSISGSVTVETFVPGSTTGWANWGANGVFGQTVSNWESQIPMTCESCPFGVTASGSYFESIQGWLENPGTYDTTLSVGSALTPGKGFWVYVGTGVSSTSDITLSNTGSLVQGNYNVGVTAAGSGTNTGYNLVSNPYASPVSWARVLAASGGTTNFADEIYVWNADLSTYTQRVGGLSNPGGTTGITDAIQAGQGFYVKALTNTNLVFTESAKLSANTNATPLLKPSSDLGKVLRLKLKGQYDWDETVFRVHPDATPGFDINWDGRKLFQSPGYVGYPGLYSKYTTISSKDPFNEDYSIQSIPLLTQELRIPVLVKVSTTGTYTISALETENIHDCILLRDKLLNATQDLTAGNYIFTITDTTESPRFELILCRDSQLNLTSVKELQQPGLITINQDEQGAFVKTAFAENTKATISAYNVIGQKLMKDIQVEGTATTTHLNLDQRSQVVFIRVTTDKESQTKKMVIH